MTGVQKLILGYIGVTIANFPDDIVLDYIEPNKLLMKLKKKRRAFPSSLLLCKMTELVLKLGACLSKPKLISRN